MQPSSAPRRQPGFSLAAIALAGAALLLAGCSGSDGTAGNAVEVDPSANSFIVEAAPPGPAVDDAVPSPPEEMPSETERADASGATIGGDGSTITLNPLSSAEIEAAKLSGELGCTFSTSVRSPILVAMGDVASREPAQGIVKVGDYVERVAAPGGFDAMLKGVAFSGKGKTIRIELTGPAQGGGESPPVPATLTYDRADGARRTLAGRWTCGP